MTYLEHIRQMNDGQFAYFLNMIQPEIELFVLAVQRAEGYNYSGPDSLCGLNGDARSLLWIMRKDYDLELKRIEDCYNPGHHLPWEKEEHPYTGREHKPKRQEDEHNG